MREKKQQRQHRERTNKKLFLSEKFHGLVYSMLCRQSKADGDKKKTQDKTTQKNWFFFSKKKTKMRQEHVY